MSARVDVVALAYLVGVAVLGAWVFSRMFGRADTADVIGATLFGGLFWPITLAGMAFLEVFERLDDANSRRSRVLAERDAAKAETERWLTDGGS